MSLSRWLATATLGSLTAFLPLWSPQTTAAAPEIHAERLPSDTAAVRAQYNAGITAFNAHDLDTFMSQFAADIEMYTPTGWLRGRPAVRERFDSTMKQFPNVRMEVDSLRVRSVAAHTVVVDFKWRVFPMGQGPAFHGVGSGVYVKRGTEWLEVLEHETVMRVDPELRPTGP